MFFIYTLNNKKYNFINIVKNVEASLSPLFEILPKFLTNENAWGSLAPPATKKSYPLNTALLSCSRRIGNPVNHSSTTVSVSPSCLSAHLFNHMRFSESD